MDAGGSAYGPYGVDTADGMAALDASMEQTEQTMGGPAASNQIAHMYGAESIRPALKRVPVPSKKRRLVAMLVGGVLIAVGLMAGYHAADTTTARATISAEPAVSGQQVVNVYPKGQLGWSKGDLTISVVDARTGEQIGVTTASGLNCGRGGNGTAVIHAPENAAMGSCAVTIPASPKTNGDKATVNLSVGGRQLPSAGEFTLGG